MARLCRLFRQKSVRRQLIAGVAGVHMLLMTFLVTELVHRQRTFLIDRARNRALFQADLLAASTLSHVITHDLATLGAVLGVLSHDNSKTIRYAMITDPRGHILAHTELRQAGKYVQDERRLAVLRGNSNRVLANESGRSVEAAVAMVVEGRRIAWVWLSGDLSGDQEHLKHVVRSGVLYTLAAIAIGTVFALLLAGTVTGPLQLLLMGTQRLAREQLDEPIPITTDNEVGRVARAFNRAMELLSAQRTELRQAGEALRASEEQLRFITDALPVVVSYLDKEERYRFSNETYETWFGVPRTELYGQGLRDVLGEQDYRTLQEFVETALRGQEVTFERVVRSLRGQQRLLRTTFVPDVNPQRTVSGFIELTEDITEQRHLEERLRQGQKMEAVGQLAGGIAHDFNNSLMVILWNVQEVLEQLKDDHPLSSSAQDIQSAAERAAALTSQLLAFSRRQVLQPKVLDLNTVVANMDRMLRRLLGEDIVLRTTLPGALARVKADPGRMEQVVMNLALNARDAMPRGGTLHIETANVEVGGGFSCEHEEIPPGPYVMLQVRDTGVGMDADTRARVFEPFFTTKEQGKGTGLGLSTVYGIVKQGGGHIFVASQPSQGSTFTVYLPRVQDQEALAERRAAFVSGVAHQGKETILMVEDEEKIRLLIRKTLRKHGYTLLEAHNGAEARRLGKTYTGQIHLLVTDVVMPFMNGHELAKALAPLHPRMRVLYMSGYSNEIIAQHGLLDSTTALIHKPFSPEVLVEKVREILLSFV